MGRSSQRERGGPAIDGLSVNRVQIGRRGPLRVIDPAAADVSLQAAVDELQSSGGGELLIQPGRQPKQGPVPYRFSQPVRIDVPDVHLRFSPGATLEFAGADALFHVRAPRFACTSARVVHVDTGSQSRSCFLLGDTQATGVQSDEASFVDCRFELTQASSDTIGFSCIRSEGDESSLRRGLSLDGCSFDFTSGVRSTTAWQGEEPLGLCAVRARNSALVSVHACHFRGPSGSARGSAGPMILLDNAPGSSIESNTFVNLDLGSATGSAGSVLRIGTHRGHPGHGTLVRGNVFQGIEARFVVELLGVRSDSVHANSFADIGPECRAVIAAGGPDAEGLIVVGNAFRGIIGGGRDGLGTPLHLDGVHGVSVSGNVHARLAPGARALVCEPGTCSDVHVAPAQASSSASEES